MNAQTAKPSGKTKAAAVTRLLSREMGATIGEIGKATSWQPHSCRAFLTGLRKKGSGIAKEQRGDGKLAYRIIVSASPPPAITQSEATA